MKGQELLSEALLILIRNSPSSSLEDTEIYHYYGIIIIRTIICNQWNTQKSFLRAWKEVQLKSHFLEASVMIPSSTGEAN